MRRTLAIVTTAAVTGGLAGAAIGLAFGTRGSNGAPSLEVAAAPVTRSSSTASSRTASEAMTPEAVYRADAPGVVVITDERTQVVPPTFFTPAEKQQIGSLGSGFLVDTRGDIVTNDHVVQGAQHIRVAFSDGATYRARLVATDPSTDIAVVRVRVAPSLPRPLRFAPSGSVQVGDPVYAIGNPFGLQRTMTAGIVSAVGRDIDAPNGLTIRNAVQTDAPINHGNSGGPLLDRFGRVIGVNAQIQGGTVDANVGIGFAIPSDTVRSVADELIATGHAQHPWLGVEIETVDPSLAALLRGMPLHGVMAVKVENGSPAAKAGLRAATREVTVNGARGPVGGDVIVAIDGHAVRTSTALGNYVATKRPGETVTLRIVRAGKTRTVTVTLGSAPS